MVTCLSVLSVGDGQKLKENNMNEQSTNSIGFHLTEEGEQKEIIRIKGKFNY